VEKASALFVRRFRTTPGIQPRRKVMTPAQEWRTEEYKGLDIHVSALPHEQQRDKWDYTVRIAQPGVDAAAAAELAAGSGDDDDYSDAEQAIAAGLKRGQAIVDKLVE
jgi:hypothetical protein